MAKRKRAGSSYQNLISHVQSAHPNYLELVSCVDDLSQARIDHYFTMKAKDSHGWIDLIVNGLLPFPYIGKNLIRKHVKCEPPSLDTFMKYLQLRTERVETKITSHLLSNITLVFDSWTSCSTHYLAVFAFFSSGKENIYETRLLTL